VCGVQVNCESDRPNSTTDSTIGDSVVTGPDTGGTVTNVGLLAEGDDSVELVDGGFADPEVDPEHAAITTTSAVATSPPRQYVRN
jgi:hypothetical protein